MLDHLGRIAADHDAISGGGTRGGGVSPIEAEVLSLRRELADAKARTPLGLWTHTSPKKPRGIVKLMHGVESKNMRVYQLAVRAGLLLRNTQLCAPPTTVLHSHKHAKVCFPQTYGKWTRCVCVAGGSGTAHGRAR